MEPACEDCRWWRRNTRTLGGLSGFGVCRLTFDTKWRASDCREFEPSTMVLNEKVYAEED